MIAVRGYTLRELSILEDVNYLTVWKRKDEYFPIVIENWRKRKRKFVRYLNREFSAFLKAFLAYATPQAAESMLTALNASRDMSYAMAQLENTFVDIPEAELATMRIPKTK